MSDRFELNATDINKWARNTFIFSIPAIIMFLTALQSGQDLKYALGALTSALISSLIDLLKKFMADNTKQL